MKRMILAALAVLVAAPMAEAQEYSAEAVAAAVLTGYRTQDATLIAPHSNATNAEFFANMMNGGEHPNQLWGGTRGAAGVGWDGMILPARINGRGDAVVPFAIEGAAGPAALGSGVAGRYMAIVLTLDGAQDTSWGFEDINYIDRTAYGAMAEGR
ncbi:hypothetical protein [Jannaschia sp. CCS1]|uniref:hypothetical protein n=1 Tax=Jannaschia sp. (strain CCS1) TaxID=290400 RepID=UPI000053BD74|nr:hypothetical protein [Jannaschia sp. CCS1]ABD55298.1 hypothetical protein Jann_2381 [Jannaschia sp. CCS1]